MRRLRESDLPQSLLNEFRRACGQTAPLLIRISSSKSGARAAKVLWDRPTLMIGRAMECDLRLPHAEVSRQHAYLQIVNGQIFCADLGSGTGTHWPQGASTRQYGALEFGVPLSIGPYSLVIEPAPQHGKFDFEPVETPDVRGIPDGMFLDFREGTNPARRWPATRDVTIIGSGEWSKVTLVHPTVSKSHCAIVRAGNALWAVDLLSEEGTIVNGDLAMTSRLEAGDTMQIGRFTVTAHYGSPLDDSEVNLTAADAGVPARLPHVNGPEVNGSQKLAEVQDHVVAATQKAVSASGGVSEQFVLDVINQMGVMQQQALQHAQQSMTQALQAVTATYQSRIENLEQEYASLKRQLRGLPGPAMGDVGYPPGLPDYAGSFDPLVPFPPNMIEPEFNDLPEPEHGSFECDDPEIREQWVRAKMKLVEAELDKTRKGWGKRLIDMMGY